MTTAVSLYEINCLILSDRRVARFIIIFFKLLLFTSINIMAVGENVTQFISQK